MDANITVGIVGIIIAAILTGVNMWWASVLNNRQIQATLQAAQPAEKTKPVRKQRKKVFGPKQRHVLKGLRLMRLAVVGSFIGSASDVLFFSQFPRKLYLDIPFAVLMIALSWSAVRVLVMIPKLRREVESGNRAIIDDLYEAFAPRVQSKKLKP